MQHVAIIDDHRLSRDGMVEIMQDLGYHVSYNCQDCVDLIFELNNEILPAICLVDYTMPLSDWRDQIQFVKKKLPQTTILLYGVPANEYLEDSIVPFEADGFLPDYAGYQELKSLLSIFSPIPGR